MHPYLAQMLSQQTRDQRLRAAARRRLVRPSRPVRRSGGVVPTFPAARWSLRPTAPRRTGNALATPEPCGC